MEPEIMTKEDAILLKDFEKIILQTTAGKHPELGQGTFFTVEKRQMYDWLTGLILKKNEQLDRVREEVIADIIHSWNKAEQRLDGTAQGAVNCIEQFRNTIKALKDKK